MQQENINTTLLNFFKDTPSSLTFDEFVNKVYPFYKSFFLQHFSKIKKELPQEEFVKRFNSEIENIEKNFLNELLMYSKKEKEKSVDSVSLENKRLQEENKKLR